MSNHKHLADLLKVCSILPALAIVPAMAEEYTVVPEDTISETQTISGSYQWLDASTAATSKNQSVWFIKGADVTVSSGAVFANNKADSGVFSTSSKAPSSLTLNSGVVFENNAVCFDGGAVANYDTLNANGVTFRKNTAQIDFEKDTTPMGGGAIALGSESKTMIQNSMFSQNESKYHGGAIAMRGPNDGDNSAADLDILDSEFNGNIAAQNGGAIYSTFYDSENVKDSVYIEDSEFVENEAVNGGAIYNEGLADRGDNVAAMKVIDSEFVGNIVTNFGGAVYNGSKLVLEDSEFSENNAYVGGAMFLAAESDTIISNSVFDNNTADFGGAIYTSTGIKNVNVSDSKFTNNSAKGTGAFGLFNKGTLTNVLFENNKSTDATSSAGALFLGSLATVTLNDVEFIGNTSASLGGAIATRVAQNANGTKNRNDGMLDIIDSTFVKNTAATDGGAIYNTFYTSVNAAAGAYVAKSSFLGNKAANGGAIYNDGTEDYNGKHAVLNLSDLTFADNVASDKGGAIFNGADAVINMSGTNTFANNTHGEYAGANDIYNLGTLNITDGTTTIGGGIAGTGDFVLENGATLNIGTALIQQGTVNLDGAIVASAMNSTSFGRFAGDVTVGDNATLDLTVGSVGTYDIFAGKTIDVSKVTVGDTYLVESSADGIVITTKAVEDIAADTGLTTQAAGAIAGLANSDSSKMQQVSLALQEVLNSGDVAAVESETAKLNPTDKPVVQAATASVQNQVLSLAAGRMAGGAAMGRAGGDIPQENGFWMQGLFNKSKLANQFHGYTRGVAFGFDMLIDGEYTLGSGLAINDSDVHSNERGHTEIDSKTMFLYGQYKPSEWFVNAAVTYSMAEYTEQATVAGYVLTDEYDVDSYGAQVMAGYDFDTGVTTEFGVRYLHIAQEDYTKESGATVSAVDTDVLTTVAGAKYAFAIENDWAIQLKPELRAALTYDWLNDSDAAIVDMPGVAAYRVEGENLNRLGAELGAGVTLDYKGLKVTLMYGLDLHKDYTSQTGMIKFRGQF